MGNSHLHALTPCAHFSPTHAALLPLTPNCSFSTHPCSLSILPGPSLPHLPPPYPFWSPPIPPVSSLHPLLFPVLRVGQQVTVSPQERDTEEKNTHLCTSPLSCANDYLQGTSTDTRLLTVNLNPTLSWDPCEMFKYRWIELFPAHTHGLLCGSSLQALLSWTLHSLIPKSVSFLLGDSCLCSSFAWMVIPACFHSLPSSLSDRILPCTPSSLAPV